MGIRPLQHFLLFLLIAIIYSARAAFAVPLVELQGPRVYPAFEGVSEMISMDINADNKPDLILTGTTNIEVLLNLGNGSFSRATNIAITLPGDMPKPSVADFNGDQHADVFIHNKVLLAGTGSTFVLTNNPYAGTDSVGAVGDFNGDGFPDLVIQGSPSKLFLGASNGVFTAVTNLNSNGPFLTADFNDDGRIDLEFAHPNTSENHIFAFSTNGFLQFITNQTGELIPWAAADLNNDHHVDLVAGLADIFLGDGQGGFTFFTNYNQSSSFLSPNTLVDLDADGKPELILGGHEWFGETRIYSSLGNGEFQRNSFGNLESFLGITTVADFDGDGRSDLAVVRRNQPQTTIFLRSENDLLRLLPHLDANSIATGDFDQNGTNEVFVMGNGTAAVWSFDGNVGLISVPQPTYFSDFFFRGVVGDFNRDGHPDIAKGDVILLGHGDSSFSISQHLSNSFYYVASGDFNRDGKLDLVGGASTALQGTFLLWGNGDGTFSAPLRIFTNRASEPITGDFNGDGLLDVAAGNGSNTVKIAFGNGNATFRNPLTLSFEADYELPVSLRSADFNADGFTDIAVGRTFSIGIFFGGTNLSSTLVEVYRPAAGSDPWNNFIAPQAGDFNSDGKTDLSFLAFRHASPSYVMLLLLGHGDGTFTPQIIRNFGYFADLNNDDKPDMIGWEGFYLNATPAPKRVDLFFQNTNGLISDWFLRSTNFISSSPLRPGKSVSPGWKMVGRADFDGDTNGDFLWQHANGSLAIWFMRGTNYLRSAPLRESAPSSSGWRVAAIADFNNDQQNDLLWHNLDGRNAFWFFNGTNFLGSASLRRSSPGWKLCGAADFNADSQADVLWQNTNGVVGLWLMDQTNIVSSLVLRGGHPPANGWHVAAATDLNEDNRPDILFQRDDGHLGAWLMNGTNFLQSISLPKTKPGRRLAAAK